MEDRRDVLREGSASAPAAVTADREVADLKSLRGRLADQVDLLPAVVMREESEANWPPTSALARQKLAAMRERLARLQCKRPVDRSAVEDADIGSLVQGVGAMGKHVEFLQKFEVTGRTHDRILYACRHASHASGSRHKTGNFIQEFGMGFEGARRFRAARDRSSKI